MPSLPPLALSRRLAAAATITGVMVATAVVTQLPASAATTLTVSTTADVATNAGACGSSTITTAASPLSLREATCLANNIASSGPVTINVPAGTYTLTNGQLLVGTPANSNVSIVGAGAASTIISGNNTSRVMWTDYNVAGGVNVTLSGLTVTGGNSHAQGGGAIISGSQTATTPDTLTIDSSVLTDNHSNTTSTQSNYADGGAVFFSGGSLAITNSTLSSNSSGSSEGSAVSFRGGTAAGQLLTVDHTTFSANSLNNTGNQVMGGALYAFSGARTAQFVVSNSVFRNNIITGTGVGYDRGAGIFATTGALTVTGSTFVGNSATGGSQQSGGAIQVVGDATTMHYNRFTGNVATSGSAVNIAGTSTATSATDNWWGCNGGPGANGCDALATAGAAAVTTSPWLTLSGSASPATLSGSNAASTVTASLLKDSSSTAVSSANLGAFEGLPVTWSNVSPSGATASPTSSTIAASTVSTSFTSGSGSGVGGLTATLDNAALSIPVTVDAAPSITSADSAPFTPGTSGTFGVTTTGYPTPTVSESGSLPSGVTFRDNHDGTATLSGTPTTSGSYPLTITAANGTTPDATQTLTVTVGHAPSFTSPTTATATVGTPGSFTITTDGTPTVSTISETGTLPAGMSFKDNGNGTATLSGTPSGAGGSFPLTFGATNGVTPNATQQFTLVVDKAPTFTSADSATFTVGDPGSFRITTTPGFPVATTVTENGALPSGMTFTDNRDGTATLAGTPAAGTEGDYPVVITADNTAQQPQQAFTISVLRASQTLTDTSIAPTQAAVGTGYQPSVTSDSGLPVTVSIDPASTAAACAVDGSTVTFTHAGGCLIDVDQAGDGTYAPAPRLQYAVEVVPQTTSLSLASSHSPSSLGTPVRVTATVSPAGGGTAAGSVQFSVDGRTLDPAVDVVDGHAQSPVLTDADGQPLMPGAHDVSASFVPLDASTQSGSDATATQVVDQGNTTTTVTVGTTTVTAEVMPVAPATGHPSGAVTFSVDGDAVGTSELQDGWAVLPYAVPTEQAHQVAAVYSGGSGFTGSSAATSRNNPTITATTSSASAMTKSGWYHTPVTVAFTCLTAGAELTQPCPAPVTLSGNGAAQSVTRTITATDGGVATVAMSGINIDRTAPSLSVTGVRNGATYNGAPSPRCVARDDVSGIASCHISVQRVANTTTYRAVATDRAGNTATTTGRYRTSLIYIARAAVRGGAFAVVPGRTYTVVVTGSRLRPYYYDAAPAPRRPSGRDKGFHAAGPQRWILAVTMTHGLPSHPYWNIGVRMGRHLHAVKILVLGTARRASR